MNPTILNFPTLTGNPAKLDWQLHRMDASFVSPLSGARQDIVRPGAWWEATMSWDVLAYPDSQLLTAWAVQMSKGGVRTNLPNYAFVTQGSGISNPNVLLSEGFIDPAITYTRTSPKTYFDINGVLQTAANNVWPDEYDPVTHAYTGHTVWQLSTNYLLNYNAPATQTLTLAVGSYVLWCIGTGSATVAAGTAVGSGFGKSSGSTFSGYPIPAGGSVAFTISTAGTVTVTVVSPLSYFQLEPGSLPTPIIPTTTTAVTRDADAPTVPLPAFNFNTAEGTFVATFIEFGAYSFNGGGSVITGSSDNPDYLKWFYGGSKPLLCYTAGLGYLNTPNLITLGIPQNGAVSWSASGRNLCLNGGTVASDSAVMATPTELLLGAGNGSWPLNGGITSLLYDQTAMTAAQLQAATASSVIAMAAFVNGSGQSGLTLNTGGWVPSSTGVLKAGDMFNIYAGTITFTAAPVSGHVLTFRDYYGNSYGIGTGNGSTTVFNLPGSFFTGYAVYDNSTLQTYTTNYTTTMGHQLLMVMQDVNSDSNGDATITIEPALRISPADKNVLNTIAPAAVFAFAKPSANMSYTAPRLASFSMSLSEDILL